jgi:hypothetical protein
MTEMPREETDYLRNFLICVLTLLTNSKLGQTHPSRRQEFQDYFPIALKERHQQQRL